MWLGRGDIVTTMNLYVKLDMKTKCNITDTLNDKLRKYIHDSDRG